jgi:hypothetical protein
MVSTNNANLTSVLHPSPTPLRHQSHHRTMKLQTVTLEKWEKTTSLFYFFIVVTKLPIRVAATTAINRLSIKKRIRAANKTA